MPISRHFRAGAVCLKVICRELVNTVNEVHSELIHSGVLNSNLIWGVGEGGVIKSKEEDRPLGF